MSCVSQTSRDKESHVYNDPGSFPHLETQQHYLTEPPEGPSPCNENQHKIDNEDTNFSMWSMIDNEFIRRFSKLQICSQTALLINL